MMQTEEYDESQAGDESMTGPGAPTPLTALEVRVLCIFDGLWLRKNPYLYSSNRVFLGSPSATSS